MKKRQTGIFLLLFMMMTPGVFAQQLTTEKDQFENEITIYRADAESSIQTKNICKENGKQLLMIVNRNSAGVVHDTLRVQQQGAVNTVFSRFDSKHRVFQRLSQKGEENDIHVVQVAGQDSTNTGKNSIQAEQKGSGNRVTIIQN